MMPDAIARHCGDLYKELIDYQFYTPKQACAEVDAVNAMLCEEWNRGVRRRRAEREVMAEKAQEVFDGLPEDLQIAMREASHAD